MSPASLPTHSTPIMGRPYLTEDSALGSVVGSIQDSISSYARTQTFETGANLPSTPPPGKVFLEDDLDDEYDADNDDHDHGDLADLEEDGNRLVLAAARGDEELLIGSGPTRWEDAPSINVLGPPSTLPSSTSNRHRGYVIPYNYQNRASRERQPRVVAARSRTAGPSLLSARLSGVRSPSPHERTPLVLRSPDMVSTSSIVSRPSLPTSDDVGFASTVTIKPAKRTMSHTTARRRKSSVSKPQIQGGTSTFGQTVSPGLDLRCNRTILLDLPILITQFTFPSSSIRLLSCWASGCYHVPWVLLMLAGLAGPC